MPSRYHGEMWSRKVDDPLARALSRYGAALGFVLLAVAIRWVLQPALGGAPPYITFYLAVLAAAAYGGLGPGMLATASGALLGAGLATLPEEKPQIASSAEQVVLIVYVLSGTAISLIAAWMHEARSRAASEAARFRELGEELRVANERLIESDRSKDRLLALVAHELRNPLAPIKSGLHILVSAKPTQKLQLERLPRSTGKWSK